MTRWVIKNTKNTVQHSWPFLREGEPIIFSGEVAVCGALNSSAHEIMADHVERQYVGAEEL